MNLIIIYILFIAFVFRVVLLMLKRREPIISDAKDYHLLALSLTKGQYKVEGTKLDEFRTPGYPFFISLVYRIFGVNQAAVFAVQILLNLTSIYLAYLIGSTFSPLAGIIAACVLCIEPDFIYYVYDLLTETLFTVLLLLSVYLMLQTGFIYPILCGLTLAAMTYVKPAALFLPVVYWLVLPFDSVLILTGAYLVPLIPWFTRNYLKYGFFRFCSISGYNLLVFDLGTQSAKLTNYTKATKFCRVAHGFKRSHYNTYIAKQAIRRRPFQFIRINLIGIYRTLSQLTVGMFTARFLSNNEALPITPTTNNFMQIIKSPSLIQLFYLLCLYTAVLMGAFREPNFITGVIAYFILIPGGSGAARYRAPVVPLLVLMMLKFII